MKNDQSVILNEVKDLYLRRKEILRFAQNDTKVAFFTGIYTKNGPKLSFSQAVIPVKTGIQVVNLLLKNMLKAWIPVRQRTDPPGRTFAGMTTKAQFVTVPGIGNL